VAGTSQEVRSLSGRPSEVVTIRVFYPLVSGRIALRTERDWHTDIEPTRISEDGTCFEFEIPFERSWLYFKPVLADRGSVYWSQGNNYLVVTSSRRDREIWPHFFESLGSSKFDRLQVPIEGLPESHFVTVYHPPGYQENSLRHYPVLYMQDGQNLFFPEEAFAGNPWRVDETLTVMDSMNIMRRTIIVGIYPRRRMDEYTMPGYARYGRYIVDVLKPYIDGTYRTMTGPENTAVMGSSLGGVVTFYLAWQYPEIFGMAACMSSTFGWRDDLMERIESEAKREIRIYLDSGWPGDNYEITRGMRDLLLRRGWIAGLDLLYYAFPNAIHNEQNWAMRSHIPFQFFFGR